MSVLAAMVGLIMVAAILWEGFEVIVLPRRVTRRFRFSVFFYRVFWRSWKGAVFGLIPKRRQETWLGLYGPLFFLVVLSIWAGGLIVGFALLHWACGSVARNVPGGGHFFTDLYLSGTTFFTLGLGDVIPITTVGRLLTVAEAGIGFGFLALVIGFLPPLNQSFSKREAAITLLDARAGSPPTAGEMLRRHADANDLAALRQILKEWETWSAEFLEEHISYPMLAYFRSQHSNQSWLGALAAILDTCALLMVGADGACKRQAQLTYAMARHAVVDLTLVFGVPPKPPAPDRLPPKLWKEMERVGAAAGLALGGENAISALDEIRRSYEPHLNALATLFHLNFPPWLPAETKKDNWQANPWNVGAEIKHGPHHGRLTGDHF